MSRPALTLLVLGALAAAVWFLFGGEGLGPDAGDQGGTSLIDGPLTADGDPLLAGGAEGASKAAGRDPLESGGAAETQAAGGPGALVVEGRVVDERRRPVAGARVALQIGSRPPRLTESGASGAYAYMLTPGTGAGRRRATLVGRVGETHVGTATAWLPVGGGRILAPPLVLSAAAAVTVRVVRDGAAAPGARVAVAVRVGGAVSVISTSTADGAGRVTMGGLPPGPVEVFAGASGHGRGHARASLPRPAGDVLEVALQAERTLQVIVVDAATERPVAGAEVLAGDALTMPEPHGPGYVPLPVSVRTDRDGRVTLRGLAAQDVVYVNARAPGYAMTPWWQGRNKAAKPDQTEILIALARFREVTFPVADAEAGVPADGTALRIELAGAGDRGLATSVSGAMEDGSLVVRGLPGRAVRGVAVTPAGAQALFQARANTDAGDVVTFRLARDVRVRLVEPDGGVVPAVRLRLNPMRKGAEIAPAETDAAGIAHFTGVGADIVSVHLVVADQPTAGTPLGKLDLTRDEDVYEVELQARLGITIAVLIEDEPRLPAQYTLMAAGQRISTADIEEDPEAGSLRAWLRLPSGAGEIEIALHADGYLPSDGRIDLHGGGEAELEFVLRPAGSLVVLVKPPEDGGYALRLQRFDDGKKTWVDTIARGTRSRPLIGGESGTRGGEETLTGLVPGRYRATDPRTQTTSEAVNVTAGGTPARVTLDLSGSTWLEGRVVAPSGTNLRLARVLVEGRDDGGNARAGTRPDEKGVFKLRAQRGRSLTLRVTHPVLAPASSGGRVTARPDGSRVELRLEEAGRVRFRLVGFEDAQTPATGNWYAPLQVHVFRADGRGAALRVIQPIAQAGLFEFGGLAPGVYRIVLVYGIRYAPSVLPKVTLGGGLTDLGTLTPSTGEVLHFRARRDGGEGTATLWATVTHEGVPAYTRRAERVPETNALRCSGIGAGTFRVVVRGSGLAPGSSISRVLLDERMTFDGVGETTIDVGVR